MRHARLHPRQGLWQRGLFPTQRTAQCTLGTGPAVFSPALPSTRATLMIAASQLAPPVVGGIVNSKLPRISLSTASSCDLAALSSLADFFIPSKLPPRLLEPPQPLRDVQHCPQPCCGVRSAVCQGSSLVCPLDPRRHGSPGAQASARLVVVWQSIARHTAGHITNLLFLTTCSLSSLSLESPLSSNSGGTSASTSTCPTTSYARYAKRRSCFPSPPRGGK